MKILIYNLQHCSKSYIKTLVRYSISYIVYIFLEVEKKIAQKRLQASSLLPCHCRLVFKLFFAMSAMLWAHLLQKWSL